MYLARDEIKKLERLALALGYFQTRGPGAGELGNVSAMMRAIAAEEVTIERVSGPGTGGAQDIGD